MTSAESIVLVALNTQVAALGRSDGRIIWQTKLPGVMGDSFVTLTCDGACVYACTKGKVHCLSLDGGQLLWTNELKGFGYGIASLCVSGAPSAPDPATVARIRAKERSNNADTAGS